MKQAKAFYERFGFIRLLDEGKRLFYPLTAIETVNMMIHFEDFPGLCTPIDLPLD